ncbi:MAG: biotin--[acetyl-CoA-carboxylase] ligase [Taibaiella sp.]|nr:biotin--[acetyl-CoA-carboxylase] ligase [Taibaiella sp.]
MIFLPEVNSTNIYAMKRISDGMSVHGEVIWTHHQTGGKGQRDKEWMDEKGKSVLMSVILMEKLQDLTLFQLNVMISYAVLESLNSLFSEWDLKIKWPNDIYIGDKKACGILIENGFRGNHWHHSVVGIGINVLQDQFSRDLPAATSLFLESGIIFDLEEIAAMVSGCILDALEKQEPFGVLLQKYNRSLYKNGELVHLQMLKTGAQISGKVLGVNEEGELIVLARDGVKALAFGSVSWQIPVH